MRLVLSSSNKDKIFEIQNILGPSYDLVLKSDIGYGDFEVIEDGETLRENAYKKAKALFDLTGENILADDTGLLVEALNGQPGVNTARYAGPHATYDDNNTKLLAELLGLNDKEDRKAKFVTCICFIDKEGKVSYVEGELEGYIAFERRGSNKFGYNPIFEVKDLDKTLAELNDEERLKINHRRRALDKLKNLLDNN